MRDSDSVGSPNERMAIQQNHQNVRNQVANVMGSDDSFTVGQSGANIYHNKKNSSQLSDRQKKVFLRQVYTNMQKTGKRNHHYQKIKESLKAYLKNQYCRRKPQDNEWQFRIMNSKLQNFNNSNMNNMNTSSNCAQLKTMMSHEYNMTEVVNQSMYETLSMA